MIPNEVIAMIQLTQQQHDAVEESSGEPIRAIDPATNAQYVLVRADVFEMTGTTSGWSIR